MKSHIDYLSAKWIHYNEGDITDDQMFFLITMISKRTNIDFLDLLVIIQEVKQCT
ncbi:hypothetical protein BC5_0024 [Bacillus phage BC-5]|uniref:Uncharacterized protein n=1 Tax=Bacillus phage BC-5 TaxID=3020389 RepID=A0AAF0BYD4_9CAUD|nr:hypothetical protein BC5_0024 [Bacillus phage BC-5]